MTKQDFIKQFKNSEIISDPELVFDLLDEAEKVINAKFDRDLDNQGAVIQMANLLLNIELAQEEIEYEAIPENE